MNMWRDYVGMRLLIEGVLYDSAKVAVLIEFDVNEQRLFDMKRFVSTPPSTTEKERMDLLEFRFDDIPKSLPEVRLVHKCKHSNITTWNHGYHNMCLNCGERNVEHVRD